VTAVTNDICQNWSRELMARAIFLLPVLEHVIDTRQNPFGAELRSAFVQKTVMRSSLIRTLL
jgi:hypothetical protein